MNLLRQNNFMPDSLIKIGDIEKFSIVDFPSKMAVVVFMQGCPWCCPFCYNRSLQNPKAETSATWENLLHLLEHRRGIIDAVVFSGGEPLMQDNLPQAVLAVKKMGFEAALHTGGYRSEALKKILPELVWVGFDIKAPLNEKSYKKATGAMANINEVKDSLKMLIDSGIKFECRTTCDPRILEIADIYKIADEISALGVTEYYLQKYRPTPEDRKTSDSECEKFFNDEKLKTYLKSKFKIFDMRK